MFRSKKTEIAVLALFVLVFAYLLGDIFTKPTNKGNPAQAAVMITNKTMNSGGTGIILNSSKSFSNVLTNRHVCGVVKKGGLVVSGLGQFQVQNYIESEISDLCIIGVADDPQYNTTLSQQNPKPYTGALISGHPALMPNVLTSGHVSGRKIIEVLVDFKPCSKEDLNSDNLFMCMFFGGMPVIRSYESVLVTATIMPGSSGSGVYNANSELIGVVFAGQGELGYAWTVPYEQVINFIYKEAPKAQIQAINQTYVIGEQSERTKISKQDIKKKCLSVTNPKVAEICRVLNRDLIWIK